MLRAGLILVLATAVAFGVDLTGKWTGTWESNQDGQRRTGTLRFVLQQDGERLTGHTYSKDGDTVTVRNGQVTGESVHFEVPDGDVAVKVDLRVQGARLVGAAVRDRDGEPQMMTVTMVRDGQ